MTMTPTKQIPSECKHYLGMTRCGNLQHLQGAVVGRCALYCGNEYCPDYKSKEKKDNGSN